MVGMLLQIGAISSEHAERLIRPSSSPAAATRTGGYHRTLRGRPTAMVSFYYL